MPDTQIPHRNHAYLCIESEHPEHTQCVQVNIGGRACVRVCACVHEPDRSYDCSKRTGSIASCVRACRRCRRRRRRFVLATLVLKHSCFPMCAVTKKTTHRRLIVDRTAAEPLVPFAVALREHSQPNVIDMSSAFTQFEYVDCMLTFDFDSSVCLTTTDDHINVHRFRTREL